MKHDEAMKRRPRPPDGETGPEGEWECQGYCRGCPFPGAKCNRTGPRDGKFTVNNKGDS